MRLQDKTALVTGAARGIGKSIAQRLLREGARVWICDLNQAGLAQTVNELSALGEIRSSATDVSARPQVEALFAEMLADWGRLDVLVNNAGIARVRPFLELTDADWDRTLNTNLRGTFLCSQIAAQHMVQKQIHGVILNIASTNGLRGQPKLVDYGASKAGIINLTLTLAVELAEHGIRVNAICPGTIRAEPVPESNFRDDQWEQFRQQIPLRKFGTPADVAAAAAYLASEEAGFITGHLLVVDGGLMAPQFQIKL